MTLVAAVMFDGVPMLLGDLLLSRQNDISPHIELPTVNTAIVDSLLPREEYYPAIVGLTRKIVKVNDWLVFGWTGDMIAARVVAKHLTRKFKAKRVPRVKFFEELSIIDDLGEVSCEIVGWLVDKEGLISFSWSSQVRIVAINDVGFIAGSGTADFIAQQRGIADGFSTYTGVDRAIHQAINLAGNIIGRELFSGETVYALYGGGIDLMYLSDGIFRNIDSITYFFWNISYYNDMFNMELYDKFVKSYYEDEIIIVKTSNMDLSLSSSEEARLESTTYVITGIDVDYARNLQLIPKSPINSQYFCHFLSTPFRDGRILLIFSIKNTDNELFMIRSTDDGDLVRENIAISEKFVLSIKAYVATVLEIYGKI